jgi:hypothetical protein
MYPSLSQTDWAASFVRVCEFRGISSVMLFSAAGDVICEEEGKHNLPDSTWKEPVMARWRVGAENRGVPVHCFAPPVAHSAMLSRICAE